MQEHTDASRLLALEVETARVLFGWTRQQMAAQIRVSEQQYCRMLNGQEGLSLWKLALMPARYHGILWSLHLKRIGYEVIEPGEIQDIWRYLKTLLRRRPRRRSTESEEKAGAA